MGEKRLRIDDFNMAVVKLICRNYNSRNYNDIVIRRGIANELITSAANLGTYSSDAYKEMVKQTAIDCLIDLMEAPTPDAKHRATVRYGYIIELEIELGCTDDDCDVLVEFALTTPKWDD